MEMAVKVALVEVLELQWDLGATGACAWNYKSDDPKQPRYGATVLRIPLVVSPETPVRAFTMQELKDAETAQKTEAGQAPTRCS